MSKTRQKLTLPQALAVYDRRRLLEARKSGRVSEEILSMQATPDFDAAVSALPHARAPELRPEVVAETRRGVAQAVMAADEQRRERKARLADIAIDKRRPDLTASSHRR